MTQNDSLIPFFWILGGALIMLFLSSLIVLIVRSTINHRKKEKKEREELTNEHELILTSNSIEVQDQERNRIASNLHDDLMSELQLIRLSNLNDIDKKQLDSQIKQMLKKVRHLSHDLFPPQLETIELEELINDYLIRIAPTIDNCLHCTQLDQGTLPDTIKLNLFRIFQEVITNIIKHSKASQIEVYLRHTRFSLSLLVRDNGNGFSSSKKLGIGMKTIENRVKQLQASHKYKSRKEKGCTFILTFFIKNNQHEQQQN
jgi:two-component system NarL family sensor kinase